MTVERVLRVVRPRGLTGLVLTLALSAIACLPAGSRGSAGAGIVAATAGDGSSPAASSPATASSAAPPSFIRPTPTPGPTPVTYTVRAGDSLDSIARRYKTTARSIAYWNAATYPSLDPESDQYQPGLLKLGWTLQIIPNVTFDEQTLPEPSDLVDDSSSSPDESASASDGG